MNYLAAFGFVCGVTAAIVPPFDWVSRLNLVFAAINLSFLLLSIRPSA